jgi:L-malate glycosyltransferase
LNRKTKILHLIKSLGRGGAEMLLPISYTYASHDQFDYSYAYFLKGKDDLVYLLKENGAQVHSFEAGGNREILLSAFSLAKYCKSNNIDIIHAHLPIAGVVARIAGRIAKIPVVYTEHNLMERYHPITRFLNKATFAMQAHVVSVSRDVEQSIRKHTNTKVLVSTVLNGIDTLQFKRDWPGGDELRKEYNIPVDASVIGFVAVFREQKQLPIWLTVASTILKSHPETYFLLVGAGPLSEEIENLRDTLGLTNRLILPGLKENVRKHLSAMDIFFMSSKFEGLPLALLEAMACECAIVATKVGGVPEVIESGVSGLLVSDQSQQEMVDALSFYLTNRDEIKKHGVAARKRVVDGFSVQRMVKELEGIYRTFKMKTNNKYFLKSFSCFMLIVVF